MVVHVFIECPFICPSFIIVSLDYPELPKAGLSTTNKTINFLTTPSRHSLQLTDNIEANTSTSTFSQPGNLTSVKLSSQSNHNNLGPTVLSVLPGNSNHHIVTGQYHNLDIHKIPWQTYCLIPRLFLIL